MSRTNLQVITREIFKTTLVLYLILLGIDSLRVGYVSAVFDINILLVVLAGSGLAASCSEP